MTDRIKGVHFLRNTMEVSNV